MKFRNKWMAWILLCIMAFALSGCNTTDGLSYLAMRERLLDLSSYHESGSLRFQLSAQFPQELEKEMEPLYLPSLLNAFDDIAFDYDVLYREGESKNRFCISTDHTSFDINAYLTKDGSFISEIPTVAKAFLPKKYTNAEYVAFNTKEIYQSAIGNSVTGISGGFSTSNATNLSRSIYSFFKSYLPKAKGLPEIVTKNGSVYTIHISDENVKVILQSIANAYLTDEAARGDVKKLWNAITDFYSAMYGDEFTESMYEETEAFFAIEDFAEARRMTDEFFDSIKDLSLLGDDGITITIDTGKSGYPEKAEAKIDLLLDMNKLEELTEGAASYEEPYVISAKLQMKTTLSEMNGVEQLNIPQIDGSKTISLTDWTEEWERLNDEKWERKQELWKNNDPDYIKNVQLPAPDGSITVFRGYYRYHFDEAQPKMLDDTLYVPASFFTNAGGIGYEVINDVFFLYRYGKCYYAPIGSSVWETDLYSVDVKHEIKELDGEIYLPLRAVWEAVIGSRVSWDAEKNSVNLWW